ncbi:MAG: SpoIIIAH-like family protein [Halanaerobiales bacterium]
MLIRRKFIWLMILIYRGDAQLATEEITTDPVEMVEENGGENSEENGQEQATGENEQEQAEQVDPEYMQAREEQDGSGEDFFIEYRMERDKARSEQIDVYREMINNPNTDEASKKEAQQEMLDLTDKMEKEMEIESLIRARGYNDSLAYIHDGSVDVIIRTGGLSQEDVARIGDIVVKTTGFSFDDVTIIEKQRDENS